MPDMTNKTVIVNGVVGAQHLQNAAASLHAAVDAVHQHGTHAVIIARVMVAHSTDVEPLVYVRRRYGRVVSPNSGCSHGIGRAGAYPSESG